LSVFEFNSYMYFENIINKMAQQLLKNDENWKIILNHYFYYYFQTLKPSKLNRLTDP